MSVEPACPVCSSATTAAFSACVLGRHEAHYRFCSHCQYVFTPRPHWLQEAYSSAIAHADTGLVARNLAVADQLSALLPAFFNLHGRFLDLAGGTGLLVRLLRDRGLDFYWDDAYCQNQHAVGFAAAADQRDFEAATAFEALEHMEDPLAFVSGALGRTGTRTLIFSTELHGGTPPPKDWWYYSFVTGQHIGFFSRRTLECLAQRLGCRLLSDGGLHMLTRLPITAWRYRLALRQLRRYYRRRLRHSLTSRIESDHLLMLGQAARSP